jgi:nucleoside-diphosphate-sugar epimerase
VFHLAALLSSKAERDPDLAHDVNVSATLNLFRLCRERARQVGRDVRFLFPSSIAVYGLPDAAAKAAAGAVKEDEWNRPAGIYGCNKLYGEMIGSYFTARSRKDGTPGLDFRSIRFPGLISADTLPSGGTSDYAPEMIHAAAQGKPYACFVASETRMPFMTMPDAVGAILHLDAAPADRLTTRVYNIGAFSPSAAEIRAAVLTHFPDARIVFEPVPWRQAIVDTWPASVDDQRARRDWGHAPQHLLAEAMSAYLVPALVKRYPDRVAN